MCDKHYKVICISDYENHWGECDQIKGNLVVGEIYTLDSMEVHSSYTKIWLKEFPDKVFNSVHFASTADTTSISSMIRRLNLYRRTEILKEGQPCSHPGCLNHLSHPCEGCGRIGGKWVRDCYIPNNYTHPLCRDQDTEEYNIQKKSQSKYLPHNNLLVEGDMEY